MAIMSILRKIFNSSPTNSSSEAKNSHCEIYQGFEIRATPYKEAGQFQMCGVISREVDGVIKEHRFVRADRFSGEDEAIAFTFQKARQIIDLNGTRIFG